MTDPTAAMYDPHSGHRPGLPGLPPHHSPHMNHAAAGMHGYHGTPSHVSQTTNHMGGAVQPDKRDKEAIYGYVLCHCYNIIASSPLLPFKYHLVAHSKIYTHEISVKRN
jgi:hypothetical protein